MRIAKRWLILRNNRTQVYKVYKALSLVWGLHYKVVSQVYPVQRKRSVVRMPLCKASKWVLVVLTLLIRHTKLVYKVLTQAYQVSVSISMRVIQVQLVLAKVCRGRNLLCRVRAWVFKVLTHNQQVQLRVYKVLKLECKVLIVSWLAQLKVCKVHKSDYPQQTERLPQVTWRNKALKIIYLETRKVFKVHKSAYQVLVKRSTQVSWDCKVQVLVFKVLDKVFKGRKLGCKG